MGLYILFVVIGLLVGFGIGIAFKTYLIKDHVELSETVKRRGIITFKLRNSDNEDPFNSTVEIGEIDRTSDKSKIFILSVKNDTAKYDTPSWRKKVIEFKNNEWVETKDIDWIQEDPEKRRREVLNKLLGDSK